MAEFIYLINDVSTPVKLGWVGVLVWSAVQFIWYRRGRGVPGEMETAPGRVSLIGRLFTSRGQSSEDADGAAVMSFPLSIAPARALAFDAETPAKTDADRAEDSTRENIDADWFEEELLASEMPARGRSTGRATANTTDFPLDSHEAF